MIRRPPRSTRSDTLLPYTTPFRAHLVDEIDAMFAPAELRPKGFGTRIVVLPQRMPDRPGADFAEMKMRRQPRCRGERGKIATGLIVAGKRQQVAQRPPGALLARAPTSEERRVGQECVSKFSTR